jgi:hypothetical protein
MFPGQNLGQNNGMRREGEGGRRERPCKNVRMCGTVGLREKFGNIASFWLILLARTILKQTPKEFG